MGPFERRESGPVVVSPRDEDRRISTVEEWFEWAPPLGGEKHWVDGRSAKEVAKAWCQSGGQTRVPAELQALLASNEHLGAFTVATVIPELQTQLGDVPRGARRHDLVLLGVDASKRRTLVGLEAKADEPFDASVAVRIERAQQEKERAIREERVYASAQIPRIQRFARALFGRDAILDGTPDPVVSELPYQLLAGLAGTLIEAGTRDAEQAAFVVHAFHSQRLDPERVAANDAGWVRFLQALPGGDRLDHRYGQLHGPLEIPGGEGIPSIPLYVGIATSPVADHT
jgi:Domain of unknown function (DUF6946)